MRRIAKATSAGSTQRQAAGLGRIFRGAFATRPSSLSADGSGAPSVAPALAPARIHRIPVMLCALLAASLVALTFAAGPAHAAKGWVFKENFGPSSQPTFSQGGPFNGRTTLAVDDDDRLYVFNHGSSETLSRWNADGTPANFSALGTNVIDGAAGGPDATPQGSVGGWYQDQVAVDNSGGINDGNIYLGDNFDGVINIFDANGAFLGQLTASDAGPFDDTSSVAVDDEGVVYVGDRWASGSRFHKYEPAAKPPVNADNTDTFTDDPFVTQIAIGDGPTDGYVFYATNGGVIQKMDVDSGNVEYAVTNQGYEAVAVEPVSGHVFATADSITGTDFIEFDASGPTEATVISHAQNVGGNLTQGIAPFDAGESLYFHRGGLVNVQTWEAVAAQEAETGPASLLGGAKATVTGTVKPFGTDVRECYFEYGRTTSYGRRATCDPDAAGIPIDSGTHQVSGELSGLLAHGTTYHYRLVTDGAAFVAGADRTLRTANTYSTEPATDVTGTTATLHGIVKPEGVALTDCYFEYGTDFFSSQIPCEPEAASIPPVDAAVAVSAAVADLESSSVYRFRLVARNALGQITTSQQTFTTPGPPVIVSQAPLNVTQATATLQARINPAGSFTNYHFEWGPDTGYGTRVPADFNLSAGSGTEPVIVDIPIRGLTPQSVYHFRVTASNGRGTAVGPDQPFQTLGANGLPDNRAIELVTPADKGPAGQVDPGVIAQLVWQASSDGNSVLYPIENGIPESSVGGWARWQATRGEGGWNNSQVSAPSLVEPLEQQDFIYPSKALYAGADLGCALVQTNNPLTEDTPPIGLDLGVENLYRWSAEDGSYDLLSDRLPLNPEASTFGNFYSQIEASDDCDRIYFRSVYTLIRGASGLYVWDEGGTLRDAGRLPLPDGSPGAPGSGVIVGGAWEESPGAPTSRWNAVTPEGTLFFSATSNTGLDSGRRAIFMREDDGANVTVTDISLPGPGASAAPNGARFDTASPDGRKVFFVANQGLTAAAGNGATNAQCDQVTVSTNPPIEEDACDLYVYDTESGELTDLSANSDPDNPIGAAVQGMVAVDEDGSHAYFAALGQLLEGKGRTYAQNIEEESANIYLAAGGELTYVATLDRDDLLTGGSAALMRMATRWTADVSADGRRLVFESAAGLAGNDTGGGSAVYLYDAEVEKLSCISCVPGGGSLSAPDGNMLARPGVQVITPHRNRSLSADGNRVFFQSPDVLATGAEPGVESTQAGIDFARNNIYQWHEGQVTFLSAYQRSNGAGVGGYIGAGADGRTVFLATTGQLLPEDTDFVSDIYAVRVDGGFTPPPGEGVCNPLSGGSCEGQGSSDPGAADVATSAVEGRGNQAVRWHKTCPRGKRKVTRNGKARCVKKQAKKSKRTANKTQRASR